MILFHSPKILSNIKIVQNAKDCTFGNMILVTGGTGLLGSHLLYQLSLEGQTVRALYRDKKRIETVEKLFKYYNPNNFQAFFDSIEWVQGDILDLQSLEDAIQDVKIVYHCAAMVSFAKRDFYKLMKVNREGTANIVNTCLDFGVEKLCYVSSTASIGGENNELISEKTKWELTPKTSGYSISKYSAEKEVWRGVEEGLDCIIVNPSVIFGAGNWDESSLTIFRTINNGLRFYTSGCNAFVDARDVAEIMVRLTNSETKNERYLCVGECIAFKDVFEQIAIKMGKTPPSINTPKWLVGFAWRISWFLSLFTRRSAAVTRESARSAFNEKSYTSDKIKKHLSFNFRSLDDSIENTIQGKIS